jgi:glutaredoxin
VTEYLSAKGVSFEEINIRKNPEVIQDLIRRGVTATPALFFGDELVIGFDAHRIDLAIEEMRPES